MAKKKDNTFLYLIGAAAILLLLMRKRKKGTIIVDESKHIEFLPKGSVTPDTITKQRIKDNINISDIQPYVDENEYFKDQYKQSLNACSY